MKKSRSISWVITLKLLVAVIAAFVISCAFSFAILYTSARNSAFELVKQNAFDVSEEIYSKTGEYYTQNPDMVQYYQDYENGDLKDKLLQSAVPFVYLTDDNGTITAAGSEEYIGRSLREIPEIDELIDAYYKFGRYKDEYSSGGMTQKPALDLDGKTELYYCVLSIPKKCGFLFMGVDPEEYNVTMIIQGAEEATNRHIGQNGFIVLADQTKRVLTSASTDAEFLSEIPHSELIDEFFSEDSSRVTVETIHTSQNIGENEDEMSYIQGKGTFWGKEYYYTVSSVSNYLFVYSLYPVDEALSTVDTMMKFLIIVELVIFTVLFFTVRLLIKRTVVKKLSAVNASLAEITSGNLDERVEVRDTQEFDALSTDINTTVDKLKEYIAEAAARIDADLEVAKAIQSSALPSVFPPFPDRTEFELYASMKAAKEVGGDFYDFFMLNGDTLGFLIADVSGKSIPGAMFMMTAKAVIKSLAGSGLSPSEVLAAANDKLCEGNDAEMFVTVWLGYLDLNTGMVRAANGGHNPPVLIHNGKAEYLSLKPGLMLALMEGMKYQEHTVQLHKGDILYLYTDGVTEAMNKDEELYGETRLKEQLSFGENIPDTNDENCAAAEICNAVTADVNRFTADAEQSDDITMLCIRYLGGV
ncbi:MAG: SpoIIE family protein phosphatase [Ruminococcus sp.]|nr:SpoIIE family protein phosphatase [Ruminococcus sp.]